jgi:hypothetical protein
MVIITVGKEIVWEQPLINKDRERNDLLLLADKQTGPMHYCKMDKHHENKIKNIEKIVYVTQMLLRTN